MINLLYALVTTIIVYVLTMLTAGVKLPVFTVYIIFAISYMFIKEIKYEVKK